MLPIIHILYMHWQSDKFHQEVVCGFYYLKIYVSSEEKIFQNKTVLEASSYKNTESERAST